MKEHPRNVCACVWKKEREWDGITDVKERVLDIREVNSDNFTHDSSFGLNGAQKEPALSSWAGYVIWNHVRADSSAFSLDIYTLFLWTLRNVSDASGLLFCLTLKGQAQPVFFISKNAKINISPANGEPLTPPTPTSKLKKVTHNP